MIRAAAIATLRAVAALPEQARAWLAGQLKRERRGGRREPPPGGPSA